MERFHFDDFMILDVDTDVMKKIRENQDDSLKWLQAITGCIDWIRGDKRKPLSL